MTDFILHYHAYFSVILFATGFIMLLLSRNMIKKIIGMNIMDSAVYLFLAVQGYVHGGIEPIIREGMTDASYYVNPVPSSLVLTGIVVSVSVTAFALALTQRLYKKYGTVNIDEMTYIARNEKNGGTC